MSLSQTYESILKDYLGEQGEHGLLKAYDMGKQFQSAGISPDELIGVHLEAIETLSTTLPAQQRAAAVLASFNILLETMVAYGIAFMEGAERERREVLHRAQITQLLELDHMKDQFLGILSHELRTPINAIMGFASILEDEVAGPLTAEQQPFVAKILGSSEVMLALVNDLLDMSSVHAGKFGLLVAPMQLEEVVVEALSNVEGLATLKAMHLINEVPDGLPTLLADRQRIGQALTNLLTNAIKFTNAGGTITVRASIECDLLTRAPQALKVEVEDTGIGITPADHAKIFTKFIQVDMTNTRPHGGVGLGLSISKALVEAHGGAIGVRSSPASGSTFWFTIPLSPSPVVAPEDAAAR
jgi:signal transduction histidine kinase